VDRVSRLTSIGRVIRAVVRNPSLRRVQAAFLLFCALEYGSWVAILLYAYAATGPASVGIVAMVQLVPAALLAPFAATLADRYRRDRVLLGGYLGQAVAFGAAGVGMVAGAPPLLVYAVAATASAMLSITRPAQGALLPSLARTPEELGAANGLAGSLEGLGLLLGPLAAAAFLLVGTPGTVFVAGALAALMAALLVAGVRPTAPAVLPDLEPSDAVHLVEDTHHGVLLGIRALATHADTRLVVGLLALRMLVIGCLDVLFVLLGMQVLGDESAVGLLSALNGLGTLLGGIAAFVLVGWPRLAPALAVSALTFGGALAVLGAVPPLVVAAALIVVIGIGSAGMDVAGRTILQRATPNAMLARVLGGLEGIGLAALAAGSILVPVLEGAIGLPATMVAVGLLLPAGILVAWRGLRRIDRRVRVPVRELALVRRTPVFAPLAPPQLEAVAARAHWMTVERGEVVIREGDHGDRYYILESGRLRITRGGTELRIADRPADGFGEIALLRNVPRTATVTALEPCVLLALDRADFLEALTGHEQAREVAERQADERSRDRTGSAVAGD
jgi:MFS family permease